MLSARTSVFGLWILAEIAIAACDLAEVIGTIIALNLLFGLPYLYGLLVCAADTFLLLAVQKRGVRLLEIVTLGLIGVIAVSFFIEIVLVRPDWLPVVQGFVPALDPDNRRESLYVAIGMLGATVMPHNLYLHSALVQTRAFPADDDAGQRRCSVQVQLLRLAAGPQRRVLRQRRHPDPGGRGLHSSEVNRRYRKHFYPVAFGLGRSRQRRIRRRVAGLGPKFDADGNSCWSGCHGGVRPPATAAMGAAHADAARSPSCRPCSSSRFSATTPTTIAVRRRWPPRPRLAYSTPLETAAQTAGAEKRLERRSR